MLPNIKKKIFILDSIPRVHPEQIDTIAKNLKRKRKTMEEINVSFIFFICEKQNLIRKLKTFNFNAHYETVF